MLQETPGRSGEQDELQNLPILGTAFQPSPVLWEAFILCHPVRFALLLFIQQSTKSQPFGHKEADPLEGRTFAFFWK